MVYLLFIFYIFLLDLIFSTFIILTQSAHISRLLYQCTVKELLQLDKHFHNSISL